MRRVLFAILPILCAWAMVSVRAGESAKATLSDEERKILELTNAERKKNNLPALQPNALLMKAARAHSENMAKQHKMLHDLDGKTPFDRIKATGYAYLAAGENIAMSEGNPDIALVFKGWMDSKGHRENILKKAYTEIGISVFRSKNGDAFFTQVFGTPRRQ